MANDPGLLRAARLPLIELLASLDDAGWATPSLCEGWTVQEVAAHLAWASVDPPLKLVAGFLRARMDVNRLNDENARGWAQRGPAAILEQLRTNASSGARPFGVPWPAPVVDAVVHELDVRRPLGRPRAVAEPVFRLTADFLLAARWPLPILVGGNPQRRIRGVRLTATGTTWTCGSGPEVVASPETVLLLLSGRAVSDDELTGPGATRVSSSRP
ncbi:MAG: hypothetical protein JWN88_3175 [Frankiales bacterium]|jgi:uncharacterized protein (TIGR03083 family)|nr:hypothetical protein [Frankiales bacterium]